MQYYVNQSCISCGLCASLCPEVFEMTDDLAKAMETDVPPEYEESAAAAMESCPVNAIETV